MVIVQTYACVEDRSIVPVYRIQHINTGRIDSCNTGSTGQSRRSHAAESTAIRGIQRQNCPSGATGNTIRETFYIEVVVSVLRNFLTREFHPRNQRMLQSQRLEFIGRIGLIGQRTPDLKPAGRRRGDSPQCRAGICQIRRARFAGYIIGQRVAIAQLGRDR